MSLVSPTIPAGCVGGAVQLMAEEKSRRRRTASTGRELHGLGQEQWVLWVQDEQPAWCQCSGEVVRVYGA